jgi:hypothetical protein
MDHDEAFGEMLAQFARADVRYTTLEEAWIQSGYASPLLGYLLARFPEAAAFDQVLRFLEAVGTQLGDAAEKTLPLMAGVRDATQGERNRAASAAGDARNHAVMAKRPAAAAFADAVDHVLQVWADPQDEQGGNAPFPRASATVTALVSSLQLHQGSSEADPQARAQVRQQLLETFQRAVPTAGI